MEDGGTVTAYRWQYLAESRFLYDMRTCLCHRYKLDLPVEERGLKY